MYSRAIDKAIYEVQSGTVDYHTAMRKTVRDLATGLRVKDSTLVVDQKTGEVKLHWDSGYSRRLDSHIRQNLIDGVKQLQSQMLDYHGERFGSDGVEISAHAISAPDHVAVQGRQFSNEEFFKMQNGMDFEDVKGNQYEGFARPITQWSCRHIPFPIIIGVSQPVYSEEQLEQMAQNSRKQYDNTQKMRAMETRLRQLKNQRLALSASGDDLEARRVQRQINQKQKEYREFCQKHGLTPQPERARVPDYRRISTKVVEKSSYTGVGTPDVNLEYINSKDFKNKFSKISDNHKVNSSIYERCKAALIHQNNRFYEDLSVINENGELIGTTSSKVENETKYTDTLNKKIFSSTHYSLISVHNHGSNLPPTGSDLVSAGYHRYNFGIVCCHDGTVYKYSVKNATAFTRNLFDDTVDKYEKQGYNKKVAMLQTLSDLKRDYGIEWSEIK